MGPVRFESHHRVDPLLEFDNLKDTMDGSLRNVDFLNHKSGRTLAMFPTMNSLNEDLDVFFITN